jgi:hypothetical protein
MKKIYWIVIGIVVIVLLALILLRGSEDSWIKDDRGVYVKHGNPFQTPDYVLGQQKLLSEATEFYNIKLQEVGTFEMFSSDKQFLGTSSDGDYGIFVVWIAPGEKVDLERYSDLSGFGDFTKFVLLDRQGNIVRII